MAKEKVITLHTTPDMVVQYTEKWAEHIKKEHSPAEAAIAEDMLTLVKLGRTILVPAEEPKDN